MGGHSHTAQGWGGGNSVQNVHFNVDFCSWGLPGLKIMGKNCVLEPNKPIISSKNIHAWATHWPRLVLEVEAGPGEL